MTWLWLQIAKFKVAVKNLDWYWFEQYLITAQERERLVLAREEKDPFVWIHDLDGERLREINPRDIKEFIPINYWKSGWWYNAICRFWVRHPISNWEFTCECEKKYWCLEIMFYDELKEVLGLDIQDYRKITDTMRNDYLLKKNHE